MGKKNKRKTKPSSSGEDSILEEREDKHLDKKARQDIMAEPGASCTNSDLMIRMDSLEKNIAG